MGTRGVYGFRIDGQDKVTYNHFDSYLVGLGRNIIKELRGYDYGRLVEVARSIVLVNKETPPTPEQIERLKKYADMDVSTKCIDDWYVLLRRSQGTMWPWFIGSLPVMVDNHDFLSDSLWCEWAYIANLDERVLEVYRGGNENPNGPGRYAALSVPHSPNIPKYYGVTLLTTIPLDEIAKKTDAEIDELVEQLGKKADEAAEAWKAAEGGQQ